MAFWWVNQGSTWRKEILGGFMWSPKTNKGGIPSVYYDNMLRVRNDDVVFSYFKGRIGAVGLITDEAVSSEKPDFGSAGQHWSQVGWEVLVNYEVLDPPVDPRLLLDLYNQTGGSHGPMNGEGQVTMAYLFALDATFGSSLLELCGSEIVERLRAPSIERHAAELLRDERDLLTNDRLTRTERRQLTLARIGQGIFKDRVAELEPACRITGLSLRKHLVASHVKPWRDSTSAERLDGANGLLLSPHVDHLFDGGFLSFRDRGDPLWSVKTPEEVIARWHLTVVQPPRPFRSRQRTYLEYHRDVIFQA